MRRRSFLLGGFVAAIGAGFGVSRWIRRSVSMPIESAEKLHPTLASDRWLARDAATLLLAVADVIVPAEGEAPAASGIDFMPMLEDWVRSSPERTQIYAMWWPVFERALRDRITLVAGRPDPDALERALDAWHREYQQPCASIPARFFEQLRRDTLRVYYASPAGWRSIGYRGPAQLGHAFDGQGPATS